MISGRKKYDILTIPFNTFIFICVMSLFIARIASESSYNITNNQFVMYYSLLPSTIFTRTGYLQIFTSPFITAGYWEIFINVFFIFLIAKNIEKTAGTTRLLRIFLESYSIFIIFSYLFFKNSHIYGLWFYVFNIMWFYLQEQIDSRWFKYGYPIFCVIFAILILQGGKTEYWKLGHLSGVMCVILDDKLCQLVYSLANTYKIKKIQKQKDFTKNIEKQVDAILEKIYKLGYDSLTKGEKDILYKASKLYKDRLNNQL